MSSSKKETVIITGAAGFYGINMTKLLVENGYKVIGLDINDGGLRLIEECGANARKCDLFKENLTEIFKEGDYLINIVGLFKFDAPTMPLFHINAKLVKIVMEAALKANSFKKIIHVSTVGTYGTPAKNRNSSPYADLVPYSENDPQIPDNIYSVTKYMGEKIAWRYHEKGLPIAIVRPSLIYGPENRYGIGMFLQLGSYCRNIMKGPLKYLLLAPLALPCRGGTLATFIHVEDLCRATLLIMEKDETTGEAYTVGDPHPVNTIAFMDLMLRPFRLNINWRIIPLSRFLIKRYDLIFNRYTTILLEKLLNFFFKVYGWHMNYNPEEIPISIAREWIGYFKSNYYWDVRKLLKLGFRPKWNLRRGVLANTIWYKKHKWLP